MSENKIKQYQSSLNHQLLSRERSRSSEDDHHMEFVDEVNGITFINDARSISIASTRNSLEATEASVVLITGGKDLSADFSRLSSEVKQKVAGIIYLGNSSSAILDHYSDHDMLFCKADTIREAVISSSCFARPGDVVLFSPGCSDEDNYRSKGNEFKFQVKNLLK
jgi:UDP-N-acetylmuramoylalanine--D-glutamate ligase